MLIEKHCVIYEVDRYITNRLTYLGTAPQKHCVVFTKLPSNSRGVFTTILRANPAMYLTNFDDRKIEAMPIVLDSREEFREVVAAIG